ncbi:hypothetical protein [Jiangella alba]|uniref:hypothetical protein n=1 Tax=Jiangella alba TaxID=561176 RepID=UPI001C0DE4A1|nr:hypothetical protein [Jiangella alba]
MISCANASAKARAASPALGSMAPPGTWDSAVATSSPIGSAPARERLRARIAGLEQAALDLDACRQARRVRTDLDHDLATVGQPQPDDHGASA